MKNWLKDILIGAGGALLASVVLALNFEGIVGAVIPDQVVPPGAVVAFTGNDGCPDSGWELASNLEGRYIVGRHYSTLGADIEPQGLPLRAGENRSVGQHEHLYVQRVIAHNGASNEGLATEFQGDSNIKINVISEGPSIVTDPAGNIEGTNAPYVPLFLCRKS